MSPPLTLQQKHMCQVENDRTGGQTTPHRVRTEAHSLAVLLEVDVATHLPQILHLVTLTIRHTRQRVRGFGRGLYGSTQRTGTEAQHICGEQIHMLPRGEGGHNDLYPNEKAQNTFRRHFQDFGKDTGLPGRKNAKCEQDVVEGCEDRQKQTVPWRVKCTRIVCFGSENWSWSRTTLDKSKDGKQKQ